jgi:hypothetical protein
MLLLLLSSVKRSNINARTQDVWGAEGISGRVKFLLLAWAGMPKTSFRKNSDSPQWLS